MATVGDLKVNISTNTSSFNRGMQDVNRQLKVAQAEFRNASSSLKDFGKGTDGLRAKSDYLTKSVDLQKQKVQALKEQYEKSKAETGENSKETQKLAEQYNNAQAKLNKMESELKTTNDQIKLQSSNWTKLGNELKAVGDKMQKAGKKVADVGKDLSLKVTAPILAMGTAAVKAQVDWESAFTGVRKTVDATEEELAQLSQGIRDMSKEMPQAATGIAEVAESAGQLGIQTPNILDFTKTMVMLGDATNLSATEGASQLAKFANVVGMSQSKFSNLGSVIVALGNNLATTEADIVSMGMRLAGAGKQVGMSEAQIMSFSGALSSVGMEAEAGGSAFSKIMIEMQLAVETGNESLQDFANVAGMSAEQFQKAWKDDASSAIIAFVKGLGNAEAQGSSSIKVLDDMGITELRLRDSLLRASSASDVFTDALEIGTNAWEENTALANEASQRYATTESQIKILKNEIVELAREIGIQLMPFVKSLMEDIKGLATWFRDLSPEMKKTIITIAGLVAVIGPLLLIGGKIATGIGSLLTLFGTISGAIAVATTGVAAATPAVGALATVFTALTGPLGLVILAIAAITAGGIALYKHFSKASLETQKFGDEVSESTQKAMGAYEELDNNVGQSLMNMKVKHEKVSKEAADAISNNFAEMSNQITSKMDENFNADYETMNSFMAKSGALRDSDNQEILTRMQEHHDFEVQVVEQGRARIDEITRTAAAENREFTTQELHEINTIKSNMMNDVITTMSQGEVEQRSLLERQKQNASIVTAEQAAEVAKNSAKQRDEVITNAEEEYDKTVQSIIRQRDEKGAISADEAKILIAAAEHQKEVAVNSAKGMHEEIVMEAKNQAQEHAGQVDWETGEIKTKWQVMKDDISIKAEEIKTNISSAWNSVKETTSETWNNIKEKTSETWNAMQNKIEENGGGIKGIIATVGESAKTGWGQAFSAMDELTGGTMSAIKSKIEENGGGIKGTFATFTEAYKTTWGNAFDSMDEVTGGKMSALAEAVSRGLESVKDFFANLSLPEIKIPHIKMPHFRASGEFSLKPLKVPDISVDWYHTGGIFTRPTVLNGIGVGDSYKGSGSNAEAVIPLDVLWRELDKNFERLEQKLNGDEGGTFIFPIYMDSEKISEHTYKKVDGKFAMAGRGMR